MNWDKMSDFEINKAVAEVLGFEIVSRNKEAVVVKTGVHELGICTDRRDYCNNPSYAWPVIVESRIDIEFPESELGGIGQCSKYVHGGTDITEEFGECDNPLRAAMIVFLKMEEATG